MCLRLVQLSTGQYGMISLISFCDRRLCETRTLTQVLMDDSTPQRALVLSKALLYRMTYSLSLSLADSAIFLPRIHTSCYSTHLSTAPRPPSPRPARAACLHKNRTLQDLL